MAMNKKGIHEDKQFTIRNVLIVILIVAILFEGGLLLVGFILADKIECNLLWCTFTISKGSSIVSQECYINGEMVNCSEFKGDKFFDGRLK